MGRTETIDYEQRKERLEKILGKDLYSTLHSKLCEITQSVAEDSEQAEWTVGELDKFIETFMAIIPGVNEYCERLNFAEKTIKDDEKGMWVEGPLHVWFELSYAQFLTLPRLVIEHMPLKWQLTMKELLEELDSAFDWRPKEGRYWVKLKDNKGRYCHAPLADYRHGNVEYIRRKREDKK